MKMKMIITTALLFGASLVYARPQQLSLDVVNSHAGFFDVKDVELQKLSEKELKGPQFKSWNDCSATDKTDDKDLTGGPDKGKNRNKNRTNNDQPNDGEQPGDDNNGGDDTDIADNDNSSNNDGSNDDNGGGDININVPDPDQVVLDSIKNTAKEVWQFLVNNRPVVTAKTQTANALPQGLTCWNQLENWSMPRVETYRAIYRNGFGWKVVQLEFQVIYSFGGQVKGVGRYLTNATIQYKKLDVFWGFNVNADVEVPNVVNLGTHSDPIAGMQMSLRYTIKGMNHIERTSSFFIYGDGRPSDVL